MDPIHPIIPGVGGPASIAPKPVERLERISRERDRPRDERGRSRRREPPPQPPDLGPEDEDGRPRVDIRV
jgi:hypothetical protein